MEVKAKVKHIRMSSRKMRLVVNVIRGMEIGKALDQLKFINKKAAKPIDKLIRSAIANAEHNYELNKENLFIKEIRVDEGATLKRWMPRAHGRATPLRKRASHVSVILSEIKDSGKVKAKKGEIKPPVKLGAEIKKGKAEKESDKKTPKSKKDSLVAESTKEEKGKTIVDSGIKDGGEHTRIEGGNSKGFVKKIFRRKAG